MIYPKTLFQALSIHPLSYCKGLGNGLDNLSMP